MTMARAILTGLSAASLVLASGWAFALAPYNPAGAAAGTKIGSTAPYSRPSSSDRAIVTAEQSVQQTPAEPLVVSIPHHLHRQEALRRVKSGLERIRQNYGFLFNVQEEIWTGYRLQFRVSMLGQAASGSIDVTDHLVHLDLFLPWPMSKLAKAALPAIRREGVRMLASK